ncbi:HD domain-containing protein [Bacillus sp. 03113]|uniref:HD domain-containing protein n=1 Tax=Bacillus sp. 03113 TaxID=2578211 RepID=UPI00114204ED|nr:HD domain-containing protein [Bacillus sp. 03113]
MIISDAIYGEFKVDKVIEDLINSAPVQRLKKIRQGGASYLVNPKWNVTRYEHSIGVMLLIKRLGGTIEEQIAGLLHDISHTAFSHVIDFVMENREEDYHEKIYQKVITESELPRILEWHGFYYREILFNPAKWTLLEQSAPELCVDRIDYTLRDMYTYGHISKKEVEEFLAHLIAIEGKIYINDLSLAEWFVKTYYKEVIDFFMDPLNIYSYDVLAKALKIASKKGIIAEQDFLKTDDELMMILQSSTNKELQHTLNQLHGEIHLEESKMNFDIHRKNKVRLIDPSIWNEGKLVRSSLLSKNIYEMTQKATSKATEGIYIKIIGT